MHGSEGEDAGEAERHDHDESDQPLADVFVVGKIIVE